MAAAHHIWTPAREQTLRAALRTAPAHRASRRVPNDEWQYHVARALAAAEPPSSGWAPTGDAVKQHYQKRLLPRLLAQLPALPPAAAQAARPSDSWSAQADAELKAAVALLHEVHGLGRDSLDTIKIPP